MAWDLLFGSDIGLMSLAVIIFVLVIGFFMGRLYKANMDDELKQLRK